MIPHDEVAAVDNVTPTRRVRSAMLDDGTVVDEVWEVVGELVETGQPIWRHSVQVRGPDA